MQTNLIAPKNLIPASKTSFILPGVPPHTTRAQARAGSLGAAGACRIRHAPSVVMGAAAGCEATHNPTAVTMRGRDGMPTV